MGWNPIDWRPVGRTLAKIDPGPAIGRTLAQVDKTVNNNIPGGWATVGGGALLAVGITNPALLGMANSGTLTSSALTAAKYNPVALSGQISGMYSSAVAKVAATTGLSQAVVGAAAKGALIGGALNGVVAGVRGQNILEASLKGLVTGAVTGGAGAAIGGAIQGADFVNTIAGATGISAGTVAGAIGGMATGAIGGGVTSALNGGQDFLRNALIGAGIGGVTGGIFGPMGNAPVNPEDLAFQAADAANLAAQGIGANQIKDILQISYGLDAAAATALATQAIARPQSLPTVEDMAFAQADAANLAANGIGEGQIKDIMKISYGVSDDAAAQMAAAAIANPMPLPSYAADAQYMAQDLENGISQQPAFEDFVPQTPPPVDDFVPAPDSQYIAQDIENGPGIVAPNNNSGVTPNVTVNPETGVPVYDYSQAADEATEIMANQNWYQKVPDLISNAGAFLPSAGTVLGGLAAGSLIAPMIFRPQQPAAPDMSYGPIAPINWGNATNLVNPGTNPGFTPSVNYAPFGRGAAQPQFDPNAFTQMIMQPQKQATAQGSTVPFAQLQPYTFEPKTAADYTPENIFSPSGQPTGFTG